MKIQERKHVDGGMGGGHYQVRVRTLTAKEPMPENAVKVDDETPESDWAMDKNQEA